MYRFVGSPVLAEACFYTAVEIHCHLCPDPFYKSASGVSSAGGIVETQCCKLRVCCLWGAFLLRRLRFIKDLLRGVGSFIPLLVRTTYRTPLLHPFLPTFCLGSLFVLRTNYVESRAGFCSQYVVLQ